MNVNPKLGAGLLGAVVVALCAIAYSVPAVKAVLGSTDFGYVPDSRIELVTGRIVEVQMQAPAVVAMLDDVRNNPRVGYAELEGNFVAPEHVVHVTPVDLWGEMRAAREKIHVVENALKSPEDPNDDDD